MEQEALTQLQTMMPNQLNFKKIGFSLRKIREMIISIAVQKILI
jgi:hypothetical protein